MVISCPMCGKITAIFWPQHWVYRRGETYYCSEDCLMVDLVKDTKMLNNALRKRRFNKSMNAFITDKQRDEAVRIVLEGGDPRPFLTECGSRNPEKMWSFIKNRIKEEDPELWAKLPARINGKKTGPKPKTAGDAMNAMQEAADHFFGECDRLLGKDEPEQIETPEAPKRAPLQYDGYTVCCVESKTFGRFFWDRDHNHLDWTTAEGEEVSFTPTGWRKFLEEIPKVAEILGVEL